MVPTPIERPAPSRCRAGTNPIGAGRPRSRLGGSSERTQSPPGHSPPAGPRRAPERTQPSPLTLPGTRAGMTPSRPAPGTRKIAHPARLARIQGFSVDRVRIGRPTASRGPVGTNPIGVGRRRPRDGVASDRSQSASGTIRTPRKGPASGRTQRASGALTRVRPASERTQFRQAPPRSPGEGTLGRDRARRPTPALDWQARPLA